MAIELNTGDLDSIWKDINGSPAGDSSEGSMTGLDPGVPQPFRAHVVGSYKPVFHLRRYDVSVSYGANFGESVQGRLIWDTRARQFGELFVTDRLTPGQQLRIQSADAPEQDIEAVALSSRRLAPRFFAAKPLNFGVRVVFASKAGATNPFRENLADLLAWPPKTTPSPNPAPTPSSEPKSEGGALSGPQFGSQFGSKMDTQPDADLFSGATETTSATDPEAPSSEDELRMEQEPKAA